MQTPALPYLDLNDIDFEKEIGRGNFPVYKATVAKEVIAVKKMNCERKKIPREVQVHRDLHSHPNVLALLGITHSKDGFTIHICVELADKSLYHYLHTEKKVPSHQQSTKWAMQIASGLHHLHKHGLVHRDLKSPNVLLFEREDVTKVCDFGCARPLDHTTVLSGMAGTYRWMAPEFHNKESQKINQRCDVFSYGMVLYEIFTHTLPFTEAQGVDVPQKIHKGERPHIPQELQGYIKVLIQLCWKQKPNDRPTFERILQVGWTWCIIILCSCIDSCSNNINISLYNPQGLKTTPMSEEEMQEILVSVNMQSYIISWY